MRIHTDRNGVFVNAISSLEDGTDVEGHLYQVSAGSNSLHVMFQHGPVKDNGVNGPTSEALLAILIHRTEILDGKFPCNENKEALEHLRQALACFDARTANRIERDVEGQYLL